MKKEMERTWYTKKCIHNLTADCTPSTMATLNLFYIRAFVSYIYFLNYKLFPLNYIFTVHKLSKISLSSISNKYFVTVFNEYVDLNL